MKHNLKIYDAINLALAMLLMFVTGVQARTWTSTDGSKIFEGVLKAPIGGVLA